MIKVLFICHGNICRSPMAELLLKDIVKQCGWQKDFEIASAATSREEIGNGVHHGTRRLLQRFNISCNGKYARQVTAGDYAYYDLLLLMDRNNVRNMERLLGADTAGKEHLLLDYAGRVGESIADPWYTGDFELTFKDIMAGLVGLLASLGYKVGEGFLQERYQYKG